VFAGHANKPKTLITVPERGVWSGIICSALLDLIFTVSKASSPSADCIYFSTSLSRHFFRSAVTRPLVVGQGSESRSEFVPLSDCH